jgi:hypothetical protein
VDRAHLRREITLRGEGIEYEPYGFGMPYVSAAGALEAFQDVHDGGTALRFARRYGVLDLCQHGIPASAPSSVVPGHIPGWCAHIGTDGRVWEPITRWVSYARQVRALLNLAVALEKGEPGLNADWAAAWDEDREVPDSPKSRAYQLASVVNHWIWLGGVRPMLHSGTALELRLGGGGTFGILAVQLALLVTQAHNLAVCSGHTGFYLRGLGRRAPKSGQSNFCPNCEGRVAARLRKRRERARRRAEQGQALHQ